jgi:hypothetical protein
VETSFPSAELECHTAVIHQDPLTANSCAQRFDLEDGNVAHCSHPSRRCERLQCSESSRSRPGGVGVPIKNLERRSAAVRVRRQPTQRSPWQVPDRPTGPPQDQTFPDLVEQGTVQRLRSFAVATDNQLGHTEARLAVGVGMLEELFTAARYDGLSDFY